MKLWIFFSISIVILLVVGLNFKSLLKILTWISVRDVLDKFMTLGWIIVCLFDWCKLHPVHKTKYYLRFRHLIVNLHLSLMYQVLLQFNFVVFLLFLCSWLVQIRPHHVDFFVVVVLKEGWISQICAYFSCCCVDFLIPQL